MSAVGLDWQQTLRLAVVIARRELRGGLAGFRIFLACLTLGVAAIATVQSVSLSVTEGLARDGREILGGDLSVRRIYERATPEMLAYFRQDGGRVSEIADFRAMAQSGDESTLVELKAIDAAYPLVGTLQLADGADPAAALALRDGQWGVVVEARLLDRLGLAVGDAIKLGDATLQIRGTIAHEPDKLSGRGIAFGPRVILANDALQTTGLVQPGSLVYWFYRVTVPPGTNVKAWAEQAQAEFSEAGLSIRDLSDASPQVRRFVERLAQFLTLVGLTALLVGGVGVSNAVRAYLDGKLSTIATLKCLGAPGRLVFAAYLTQILLLTLLAIALGLLIGGVVPVLAALGLNQVLPVRAIVGIYPGALALAGLFGLLTALVFSLFPLGQAYRTPAAALFRSGIAPLSGSPGRWVAVMIAALAVILASVAVLASPEKLFAVWFVLGSIGSLAVFRGASWLAVALAARLPRPRRPGLRLALANLHRPGNGTGSITQSLGLGLTVLVAIALIEGNFNKQVAESLPEGAPNFFFLDVPSSQSDDFAQTVAALPGVHSVKRTPMLRGQLVSINDQPAEQALLPGAESWLLRGDRGITYATTPPEHSTITNGAWWADDYTGEQLVSVSDDFVQAFGTKVGDSLGVRVLGREITATVASIRTIDWGSFDMNFAMVFSPGILQRAPHTLLATAEMDPGVEDAVQRAITQAFPMVSVVRVRDAVAEVGILITNIGLAVRVTAGITLIAGTLVLAGAIAAGHRRRVYEAVVLKVLGATRADITRAFLAEYGLLALLTAAIAGIIGTATAWAVLTQVMQAGWVFIPGAVGWTTLLCAVITLAAGWIGTWRALGQKAAPLLRNE
jgi:putative ABC transport system permease protein